MKRIITLLSVAALAACSTEALEEPSIPVAGERVVVSATIGASDGRVAMEEIEDPAGNYIKVNWRNDDSAEEFAVKTGSGSQSIVHFAQTESTEDSPSLFEGPSLRLGSYKAIYPPEFFAYGNTEIVGKLSRQTGELTESLCMMYDSNSNGKSFHFKHQTAIINPTFKVGNRPLATNTITSVQLISETIPNKCDYLQWGTVNMKVDCDALEEIYIYIMAKVGVEDVDRSFDVYVTTTDSHSYHGTLTVPEGKRLEPGKFYTPTIVLTAPVEQFDMATAEPTPDEEIVGDGSAEEPYKIATAGDLAWMLGKVQMGMRSNTHFQLESNFAIESDAEHPWTLGSIVSPFTGVLDGKGHTISGELVADPYAFFFGFVGINQGVIENLTIDANVVGSDLLYDVGPMLSGNPDVHLCLNGVGALAGANMGVIDGCTNSGTVSGGTVTTAPDGSMMGAGGLVGFAITGSITNSSNSGNVTGTSTTNGVVDAWNGTGGVVGGVTGAAIDNCSNTGTITGGEVVDGESIAGGLVGYATNMMGDVIISGCTNSGAVNGSTDSGTENAYAGGIVGFITDSQPQSGDDGASKIENCTNNGPVTGGKGHGHGDTYTGGIAGTNYMTDIIGCTNAASATITAGDTEQVGNLQGGWIYAGGIVGYLSSHDHEAYTHSVATKVASCKNYAAVNGPLSGDWAFIGGIAGQATSGHMIITETENHGAIDGRGSENVNSLYVGGFVGRAVGDCTEIFTCVNYGVVKGGTANEGLFTGGIVGDFSGVSTYDNDPRYVSHIYDTVNEASAIVTCGVSLTATLENSKVCYGGIAGEVTQYNTVYYPYYPYVCSCCVDKSNCAGGLIGRGNTTLEVYEGCPNH